MQSSLEKCNLSYRKPLWASSEIFQMFLLRRNPDICFKVLVPSLIRLSNVKRPWDSFSVNLHRRGTFRAYPVIGRLPGHKMYNKIDLKDTGSSKRGAIQVWKHVSSSNIKNCWTDFNWTIGAFPGKFFPSTLAVFSVEILGNFLLQWLALSFLFGADGGHYGFMGPSLTTFTLLYFYFISLFCDFISWLLVYQFELS